MGVPQAVASRVHALGTARVMGVAAPLMSKSRGVWRLVRFYPPNRNGCTPGSKRLECRTGPLAVYRCVSAKYHPERHRGAGCERRYMPRVAPHDALVALEHTVAEVCSFEWPSSSSANGVHESLGTGEAGLQPAEAEVRHGLAAAEEADLRHRLQAAQAEARQGLAAAAAAEAACAVQRENAARLVAEAERARDEAVAAVRAEMDEMEARLTDAAAKAAAAAEAKVVARTEAAAEAQAAGRRSSVDLDDLVAYTDVVHASTGLAADTIVVEADSSAGTLSIEAARVAQEKAVAEAVAATRAEIAAQAP